jgi:predicted alpha/beta hydrolase family esterase
MSVQEFAILTVPGWQGSAADHWQSHWEQQYGCSRVEQHNWMRPLRGDWVARLEDVVLAQNRPCVLVAHSLGCMLVAYWAAYSPSAHRVQAALLVAPADPECPVLQGAVHGWTGISLQRLPFKSRVIASQNDPFCAFKRAQEFADAWGAEITNYGAAGHINAETGLGHWPQGYEILMQWMQEKEDKAW